MKEVETKYGPSITCALRDGERGGGIMNVFLPKSIEVSGPKIIEYNLGNVPPVSLIYKGKQGGRFVIDFE